MKLRIHADQIRLRLKQSEVRDLCEGKEVVEVCPIEPLAIIYAVRTDPAATDLTVHGEGMRITITLPAGLVCGWHDDDRVGFEGQKSGVKVLIEKDFKCLHPSSPEVNTGCWDHPEQK